MQEQAFVTTHTQSCPICGRAQLDRAYPCLFCLKGLEAYGAYAEPVSSLLRQLKVGQEKALAKVFASLFVSMLANIHKPLLVPVPASKKGEANRGFDQMLLISKLLKRENGYPYLKLFSQKGEGQSKFLSLAERKERQTFVLLPHSRKIIQHLEAGCTIVLLDDICTTGSTLETCKSLLAERYGIEALSLVIALV